MFDVLSNFEKDTPEYNELIYRILSGQNYQQNAIDKSKGIVAKSMPKEWYEFYSNAHKDSDTPEISTKKEFNMRILADKKPYFFIYIYPHLMKKYKMYLNKTNANCLSRFGLSVGELLNKTNKSKAEEIFVSYYHKKLPVSIGNSVMNKICKKIEHEFDGVNCKFKDMDFDYTILQSKNGYSQKRYHEISQLYKEYQQRLKEYSYISNTKHIEQEEVRIGRLIFLESFKIKATEICPNVDELCNIVIDLCYKNNNSKQFAWDVCADTMITNLLVRNDGRVEYPIRDNYGNIDFKGEKFSIKIGQIGA